MKINPDSPMKQLATKINAHLQRFEADKTGVNKDDKGDGMGSRPFFNAHATYYGGRFIAITYVSYQGDSQLTQAEAREYLAWLDAGNIGQHFKLKHLKRAGKV